MPGPDADARHRPASVPAPAVVAGSRPRPVPLWCLFSAVAAPAVLVVTMIVAGQMRGPGYDPMTQTLSALAAAGPGAMVMTAGFVATAACTVVTALGLHILPLAARGALIGSAVCGIALAVFRGDLTESVSIHIVAVVAGAVLLVVWPLLALSDDPATCRARRTRYSVTAAVVLAALAIWLLAEAQIGSWLGLAERVAVIAQFLWPAVVAVAAYRHHAGAVERAPGAGPWEEGAWDTPRSC